jgi:plastocyanin
VSARRPARARSVGALVLGLLAFAAAACFSDRATASTTPDTGSCLAPTSTAGASIVYITAFAYVPPTVHVKAGQSVAWVNCEPDATPHTATDDAGAYDSGSLITPEAYVRSFPAAGTFPYHCALHPFMKATVVVE